MHVGMISAAVAGVPGRYTIASVTGNTVTFTVAGWPASGTCTVSLFGWNYHHVLYDGASATTAKYDAQRRGWNSTDTSLVINTTTSPGHIMQIFHDDGVAVVSDALAASSTAYPMIQRGSRLMNLPDTTDDLFLQIRCLNGTVAPTGIVWTMGFISMEEFAPVPTVIQGAKMHGPTQSIQANVANTVTVTGTVTSNIGTGSLAAGTNLAMDVGVGIRATTTNAFVVGTNTKHIVAAASTNATSVKASAGRLYGVEACNTTSAYKYLKFHNIASAPTAGSGVVMSVGIPPNNSRSWHDNIGVYFGTGIGATITGGAADADTTVTVANDVIAEIFFG